VVSARGVFTVLRRLTHSGLNKCLEEHFADFLTVLSAFESVSLRVYDVFNAIHRGEVRVADCYEQVARLYTILEKSLGDPRAALQELSRELRATRLAGFLRGYSDVLVTSGDTRTYVNSSLRSELSAMKARIESSLRVLETLYESNIALILTLSLLVVMPIWGFPAWISLLAIQLSGLLSYILAFKIARSLYYPVHRALLLVDLLYMLALPVFVTTLQLGFFSLLVLVLLHSATRRLVKALFSLEVEAIRVFRETHSEVLLGRSLDLALLDSLGKSRFEVLRAISVGLSRGLEGHEVLSRLKLPQLPVKILTLLLNPVKYGYTGIAYLSAVNVFIEELMSTRILVREKTRLYALHVLILALLVSASYIMLSQIPIIVHGNTWLIGLYGYLGIILLSAPIGLVRDGCYVASRLSLVFAALATGLLVLITL
jgi:hypothetical protein